MQQAQRSHLLDVLLELEELLGWKRGDIDAVVGATGCHRACEKGIKCSRGLACAPKRRFVFILKQSKKRFDLRPELLQIGGSDSSERVVPWLGRIDLLAIGVSITVMVSSDAS